VATEFVDQTITCNWGNKMVYTVNEIDYESNPDTMKFTFKDNELSTSEYFKKYHNLSVTDLQQPLFVLNIDDQKYYIPPEFCTKKNKPNVKVEDIIEEKKDDEAVS
jgi:hypothetical protein